MGEAEIVIGAEINDAPAVTFRRMTQVRADLSEEIRLTELFQQLLKQGIEAGHALSCRGRTRLSIMQSTPWNNESFDVALRDRYRECQIIA